MGLSSSSGTDKSSIYQQVLASSPQAVPNQDKNGSENKQVTQPRTANNTQMESDAAISGEIKEGGLQTSGPEIYESLEGLAESKKASGFPTTTGNVQQSGNVASTQPTSTPSIDGAGKATAASSISSLSSTEASQLAAIQQLVGDVISGNVSSSKNIDTPALPKPSVTPRRDTMEIGLALAKSITALGDTTRAALLNYQEMQSQASNMSKASLEKQGLKIDSERAEFKKMQQIQEKMKSMNKMNTVNKVMMGISIAITVISVVSALFTCGAGLIASAGAIAGAAAAGAAAGGAAGATAATTAVTQAVTQTVIQTVKTVIVQTVRTAIQQGVKAFAKQGLKAAIKAGAKTLSKNVGKIFSNGKSVIAKASPNLSKVMNTLGNQWIMTAVGMTMAIPSLAQGIGSIELSNMQKDLAKMQKETGKIAAQAEMLSMFTSFWQQASKIAAKQTGDANEMSQQATKLAGQITSAFGAISQALAGAV